MLSRKKMEKFLCSVDNDTNSELDRFIQDLLIRIEFGHFEIEDDELECTNEDFLNR